MFCSECRSPLTRKRPNYIVAILNVILVILNVILVILSVILVILNVILGGLLR